MSYIVPEGASRLVGSVAINSDDGQALFADAVVQILVDGQVAFEEASLTADRGLIAFNVPVVESAEVMLQVEYGTNLDVQDDVLFLRPIFLP